MLKLKTLAAITATLTLTTTALSAQTFAVGKAGYGYEQRGQEAVAQLRGEWETENFNGSGDIARAVCDDNDVVIGIVQIDAMLQMQNEGCKLTLVGTYPADEYGMIFFPPDARSNELDDLDEDNTVLIGDIGSGSALFWNSATYIESSEHGNQSAWSEMSSVNGSFTLATSQADFGEIDALIIVTDVESNAIQGLLTDGWTLGELDDRHLDDFPFGRGTLYTRETIAIDHPAKFRDLKNDAIRVRSFYVANADWAADNQKEFEQVAGIVKHIR